MNQSRSDLRLARTWDPELDTVALGAHLVFVRRTYEHHVLYAGNGTVLEYPDTGGVREIPLAEVRQGCRYWVLSDHDRRHPALFTGPEALERARLRRGEALYNRGENNCEHLVNWALSGHHHCDQTDRGVVYVGLGFVSWFVHHPRNTAWHRARLRTAYPTAHRAAATRWSHYRELRDQGVSPATAAYATRTRFTLASASAQASAAS